MWLTAIASGSAVSQHRTPAPANEAASPQTRLRGSPKKRDDTAARDKESGPTPTYRVEDVDGGVAVRADERLGSLKLNHCCSRHLPDSKCCLNETYVRDRRSVSVCDVTVRPVCVHAGKCSSFRLSIICPQF